MAARIDDDFMSVECDGDQALFDSADWTRTRQVRHTNVVAVTQLTTLLVPSMVERGRGSVLSRP